MSHQPIRNNDTPDDTGDTGERTTRRDPINAAHRGPAIGGSPRLPGTAEHEQEVEHRKGKSPVSISTGLLWTVGILLIVAVIVILIFTL